MVAVGADGRGYLIPFKLGGRGLVARRTPSLEKMLLQIALRYQIKVVCDLGGPYTVEDERYIKIIENLHKEKRQ